MYIGIDARFAVKRRRGIGNYVLMLIRHLALIDHQNHYILYVDSDDLENILPVQNNFTIKKLMPSTYFIWEQCVLPIQANRDKIDILHCTGNTAPCFLNKNIKLITTIHDVMYLKNDDELIPKPVTIYQNLGRLYRRIIVKHSIFRANKIISISNFSKNDIISVFPTLLLDSIAVVPEAGAEYIKKIPNKEQTFKFHINGEYILALGAVDLRKNTEMIIDVFFALKKRKNIKEKLVIVGLSKWKKTQFYNVVNKSEYRDDVIFLPFLSEEELVIIYNNAKVFLYPSLYEGFGFPPLEAMACEVPVITSNLTSIPEVTDDGAILIDPRNKEEIFEAVLNVLNNDDLRRRLIEKGKVQVKKYSWEKTAQMTLKIYGAVYQGE